MAHAPKTLYDKIWDAHVVSEADGEAILYIDLHLIHEVTTPQAFAGLRAAGRKVRRPDRTLAVADHNIPTEGQALGVDAVADEEARLQLQTLARNVKPTTASSSSRWATSATASSTWSVPSRAAPSRA
jgi:3-isopropylmalate/(R)-2-methylmalate dehydratase large subunit